VIKEPTFISGATLPRHILVSEQWRRLVITLNSIFVTKKGRNKSRVMHAVITSASAKKCVSVKCLLVKKCGPEVLTTQIKWNRFVLEMVTVPQLPNTATFKEFEVHCHVYKSLLLHSILNKLNPSPRLPPLFLQATL
jgi:hypothetical protein